MNLRSPAAADTEACGRIIYEAFKGINEAHGFPPDFPSMEVATQLAEAFIANPSIFAVIAEVDGKVVGSNFLWEGDPIRSVGPISVDPAAQGAGIGRRLMQAVLERGKDAAGIRLVQDAFNTRSISLYASLGFQAKEPLMLMSGRPESPCKFTGSGKADTTRVLEVSEAIFGSQEWTRKNTLMANTSTNGLLNSPQYR